MVRRHHAYTHIDMKAERVGLRGVPRENGVTHLALMSHTTGLGFSLPAGCGIRNITKQQNETDQETRN